MALSTLNTRSTIIVVVILTSCLIILFRSTSNMHPSIPYRLCRTSECPAPTAIDEHTNTNTDTNVNINAEAGATHLNAPFLFTANRFLLNFSHTMDEKLEGRLRPKKTGVIWTAYNETMRLPIGISMFHAMHCLLFLRGVLQDRVDGTDTFTSAYKVRGGEDLHTHVPHCFSYVTQHIMCLSDSTLEPPWIDKDEAGNIKGFGIDGIGVHHQCKDNRRLIQMARRTRTETFDPWDLQDGDTLESVFGA